MRSDIAYVSNVSHHGSSRVAKKYGGKVVYVNDIDHLYEDERGGLHAYSRGRDWININHSPISGFLRKSLGRLWDDVYSEFCAAADPRSLIGRAMRKALSYEVKVNGVYEGYDGLIYEYRAGCYWERQRLDKELDRYVDIEKPIYYLAQDTLVEGFYVHPSTRILCVADKAKGRVDAFAYTRKEKTEPLEIIVLQGGGTERDIWGIRKKVHTEWYQRELCGRSPKTQFYAWFHYVNKTTTKTHWERVDGSKFAKNAHFEGIEVAPYVDPIKERYYRVRPDIYRKDSLGFWHVLETETTRKECKRSCNRKDMAIIRERLAKLTKGIK